MIITINKLELKDKNFWSTKLVESNSNALMIYIHILNY